MSLINAAEHSAIDHSSVIAPRFDLIAIESALYDLQCNIDTVNSRLSSQHAAATDQVLLNLLAAYRLADEWVESGVDVFGGGDASSLLSLNHTVLFGRGYQDSNCDERQVRLSEEYFYTNSGSHAGELIDWYQRHHHQNIWRFLAGMHVQMISTPEPFIEGNHRTSIVLISYELVRAGYAPLVLNAEIAPIYFSLTPAIQTLDKRRPMSWFKRRQAVRETERALLAMAELTRLRKNCDS